MLRRRSLQLTRASRRRRRGRGDVRAAVSRSCGEPAKARVRRGRCGDSCAAYRAGSPCAAGEVSEPSRLRSVTNTRHGGRGGFGLDRTEVSLRPLIIRRGRTARPRSRLGSPAGSGQTLVPRTSGCQQFRELRVVPALRRSGRRAWRRGRPDVPHSRWTRRWGPHVSYGPQRGHLRERNVSSLSIPGETASTPVFQLDAGTSMISSPVAEPPWYRVLRLSNSLSQGTSWSHRWSRSWCRWERHTSRRGGRC